MQGSPRAIFEGLRKSGTAPWRRLEPAPRHLKSLDNFKHLSYAPADLAPPAPDPLSGGCVRKTSLPVRLALLVAGTTLPLIVFAAVLVFNDYEQDRKDASQRVLETVRSIRLVLDAEMQRMTGALQVLSLTNALRDGDFNGFRRISQGFLDQYGKDGVILVADRDGRQLFSSVTEDAASLPPRNNRAIVDKVFSTKLP